MMTHPLAVAGKLPIKTLAARQLLTYMHTYTHKITGMYTKLAYVDVHHVGIKNEYMHMSYPLSTVVADLVDQQVKPLRLKVLLYISSCNRQTTSLYQAMMVSISDST